MHLADQAVDVFFATLFYGCAVLVVVGISGTVYGLYKSFFSHD